MGCSMKTECEKRKWVYCISALVVLLYSSAHAVELSRTVNYVYSLSPGDQITLLTGKGEVFVRGWDGPDLNVRVTKKVWAETKERADELIERFDVDIKESSHSILIHERHSSVKSRFRISDLFHEDFWESWGWQNGSVDYELLIPAHMKLRILNKEGDITVQDSKGEGKWILDANEGDIECSRIRFSILQARAKEGNVRLSDLVSSGTGTMRVRADEGNIVVNDCHSTKMDLRSAEGNIVIKDSRSMQFELFTEEGDINVRFAPIHQGQYLLGSEEGSIYIVIPESADMAVQLMTKEGYVRSDFELVDKMNKNGKKVSSTIGESDAFLKASTIEGDIGIRKWEKNTDFPSEHL